MCQCIMKKRAHNKKRVIAKIRAHNKKNGVSVTFKVQRNPKEEQLLKTVMRKHIQSSPRPLPPNHDKTPTDIFQQKYHG